MLHKEYMEEPCETSVCGGRGGGDICSICRGGLSTQKHYENAFLQSFEQILQMMTCAITPRANPIEHQLHDALIMANPIEH
jgi:hypothetical protein